MFLIKQKHHHHHQKEVKLVSKDSFHFCVPDIQWFSKLRERVLKRLPLSSGSADV